MFRAAACIALALFQPAPITTVPGAEPPPGASGSSLARIPTAARAAVTKRARFVFRMPDGSVWDSFEYIEFRKVLAEYRGRGKGEPVSSRCAAWGFAADRGRPSLDNRPSPLWHTLQPRQDNLPYTPFIYVNTALGGSEGAGKKPMIKIGKEAAPGVFEFTYSEFPGEQNAFAGLPCSINLGYAAGYVRLPRTIHPGLDGSLTGEFFLLNDADAAKEAKAASLTQGCTLVHAQSLRLSPESYATELLAGRAELVTWSFTRTAGRLKDDFAWKKTVVETSPKMPEAPERK